MLHLAHRSAVPDVGPNPSADNATVQAPNPVFISTREVIFNTAAAVRSTVHHRSAVSTVLNAISHIHVMPEPHPIYPRRESSYFEAARMCRLMEHL